MDNPTNSDSSPPKDFSKSWEENCQDQLRNIHELNQFGLQLLTDWQRRRCSNFATSCTCGAWNMDDGHIL